jgi:hypothetical protein
MKRRGYGPTAVRSQDLRQGGIGAVAVSAPRVALPGPPICAWPFTLLADERWTPALPLSATAALQSSRQWLHRLVNLSGVGWTLVTVAVLWELFALAFSECAGWAWDKGAFFFAWGLGVLAFGFCLRRSTKRPAASRLFLGVNILVLGVLSLVVATR